MNFIFFPFKKLKRNFSHLKKNNKEWKDELMKWNPSDYDNITKMNVPFDLIWTPGKIIL